MDLSSILSNRFEIDLAKALEKLGQEAAYKAYKEKKFTNRTGNLLDSYGSAVYKGGRLLTSTIQFAGPETKTQKNVRHPEKGTTGREALEIYFKNHRYGEKNDEFVVVVVAAMWYADYVQKKGYRVIKGVAYQYLAENMEKRLRPIFKRYGVPEYILSRAIGIGQHRYKKNK